MCQIVPCPGEVPHVWAAPYCKPSLVVKTLKRWDVQWRGKGGEKHMDADARASCARYKYWSGSADEMSLSTRPLILVTLTKRLLASLQYIPNNGRQA